MSRVGSTPITVPSGVEVTVTDGVVEVNGPKGDLSQTIDPRITVSVDDGVVTLTRSDEERQSRALHGLSRALINNMVIGVTEGYAKEGIEFEVPEPTKSFVRGIDKQLVGQVAADIRAVRPPEPYKGKGIRYVDEYVRRKAGKAGVAV